MAFTYFFRDRETLFAIRDLVFPEIKKSRFINIWDAGCAMGPESYSLAIIARESLGYYVFKRLKIYATDLDEENHQFGKIIAEATYPETMLKRIPRDILGKYFTTTSKPGYFTVKEEIRRAVLFQKHDLRSLIPIRNNFSLILCKNVLLHLKEEQREQVVEMFHSALIPRGFLVFEATQKLPMKASAQFEKISPQFSIYQKK